MFRNSSGMMGNAETTLKGEITFFEAKIQHLVSTKNFFTTERDKLFLYPHTTTMDFFALKVALTQRILEINAGISVKIQSSIYNQDEIKIQEDIDRINHHVHAVNYFSAPLTIKQMEKRPTNKKLKLLREVIVDLENEILLVQNKLIQLNSQYSCVIENIMIQHVTQKEQSSDNGIAMIYVPSDKLPEKIENNGHTIGKTDTHYFHPHSFNLSGINNQTPAAEKKSPPSSTSYFYAKKPASTSTFFADSSGKTSQVDLEFLQEQMKGGVLSESLKRGLSQAYKVEDPMCKKIKNDTPAEDTFYDAFFKPDSPTQATSPLDSNEFLKTFGL